MEWKTFFLIFLARLFGREVHVLGTAVHECPLPEVIYPCFCDNEEGDVWVQCNHITKDDELRDGLLGLKGLKVWKLSLFADKLGIMDANLFAGLNVERLELENTTIRLEPPQMRGLEKTLGSIHIRACYDEDNPMSGWSLEHLSRLREIIVDNNVIPTLRNNWMTSSPSSLRSLTVENNAIEKMEDSVFSHMKGLTFLFLEENRLATLKRSMFPSPASNLLTLNLRNNMISYLPYDIFEDMPRLRNVGLDGNRLSTLDETVWKSVIKQLTSLSIEENPIVCDKKIKWILPYRVAIEGTCQNPEKLKNKAFEDLDIGDLS